MIGRITRNVVQYTLIATLIWTTVLGGSLLFNIVNQKNNTELLARQVARANFNKDQAYRIWASSHGGVYVEPDERTPPSPWLAHIPDRDIETTDGKKLTLMNPAYMLRQMMEEHDKLYGIKGRIVGTVYLNPNNKADKWEEAAIRAFELGSEEIFEISDTPQGVAVRLMRPMIMRDVCMKCHGHLDFDIGDVRGGVSVTVPLAPYQKIESKVIDFMVISHGGVWLVGLSAISFVGVRANRRLVEREMSDREIRLAAKVFDNMNEATLIVGPDGKIVRVNPEFTTITGYSSEEAIGQKPSLIKSDHHDKEFYEGMWATLLETGLWQGEIWNRRKDGSVFIAWESIVLVKDPEGNVTEYIGSFYDITDKKRSEDRIQHLAHYDFLTKLPNRSLFQDRLQHSIAQADRHGSKVALLFMDLDGFKKVNDTLGHAQGDVLLQEVACRLLGCVRRSDTVARLGGDEFTVIMEDLGGMGDVAMIAEKILVEIARPIMLEEREVYVSSSIGIAIYPDNGKSGDELLQQADAAMYQAKGDGKNCFRYFSDELKQQAEQRLNMEADLRAAISSGSLDVYYQPKVNLADKRIVGFEALVRWHHPVLGLISPNQFIPLAEDLGLIGLIDALVMEKACHQVAKWRMQGFDMTLAVNLSGSDFKNTDLPRQVYELLGASGLPARCLELEITETFLMTFIRDQSDVMKELRNYGILLAIDDFGTGYSSLAYLKELPVKTLKVDQRFISNLDSDSVDRTLVTTIITLAQSLEMQVVAEGIERPEHMEFLRDKECNMGQGFYFSRPMSAPKIESLLQRGVFLRL